MFIDWRWVYRRSSVRSGIWPRAQMPLLTELGSIIHRPSYKHCAPNGAREHYSSSEL